MRTKTIIFTVIYAVIKVLVVVGSGLVAYEAVNPNSFGGVLMMICVWTLVGFVFSFIGVSILTFIATFLD